MPILLLLAGVVILVGVVGVAMGRGGEMAEFASDYVPPDVMTAADVAMLRPPSSLWGYNVQITDEALSQVAQLISERDVEIAVLRQQLAEFRSATAGHPVITATLLARSKAAGARIQTAGLDAPPPADQEAADRGAADRGAADRESADDNEPAGAGSPRWSEEAAASRDD